MYLENERELKLAIKTTQTEPGQVAETSILYVDGIIGQKDAVDVLIYELEDSVNILLLYNDYVKMIKSGAVEAEMCFDTQKPTNAEFSISGSSIIFDVNTKKCKTMKNDKILELEYLLFSDGAIISEYCLEIIENNT